MTGDRKSSESHSIGGSDLLTEIAIELRSERTALLALWHEALRTDPWAGIDLEENADSMQMESLVDRYLDALEAGSADALQRDARALATQHPPFPAGSVGFLAALLALRDLLARALSTRLQKSPARLAAALDTFEPAANRISEAVAREIVEEHARVIRAQQDAIRQLSTPVLQVRSGLLIHPIMGTVDIHRARQLTADLLASVRRNRGRVVVMDLTGVPTVDIPVATQLVHTVEAVRLLGATLIVSGLSPEVARALALTGLDLTALHAVGDLEAGLLEAETRLGLRVTPRSTPVVDGAHA